MAPSANATDASPKRDAKAHPHRGRRVAIAAGAVALALACAEVAGAQYYTRHFVPGTTVNGSDVSNLTESQLASRVRKNSSAWSTHVTGQGLDLTLTAADVDLDVSPAAYARKAKAQTNPARWALDLASPQRIEVAKTVTYDADKLAAKVKEAVDAHNQTATPPQNATVAYDKDAGKFVVKKESVGTALDATAVAKAVEKSASTLRTSTTIGSAALSQPTLPSTSKAVTDAAARANALVGHAIPLTHDGKALATVEPATSAGWVRVADDLSVTVDQDAIATWAKDALAKRVAKSDEEHDYAIDSAGLAKTIASRLEAGSDDAVEVPLSVVGTRPPESAGHESRGRHIDVNLKTQYARMYDSDGSVIWRSYIVSGNTSEGNGTPTGTFKINAKRTDEKLVGADEDHDGEPDYISHVNYWMPFIGNSVGLHDASWRGSFGGSIYAYAGSHGCVNLPPARAAELYKLVRVGDTVYVHN
jgi:lipoprotein-anchoring transpeptidase ErfK/SrfK